MSLQLQGPVLSVHKKLLAEKLAEEESNRKVKGEVKKEKHLVLDLLPFYFWLFDELFV